MNDASIDRQVADLEKVAEKFGYLNISKRHYYSDRAQSGASLLDRPGLTKDLMGAIERGELDAVLVEHTDRLSRNKPDLFDFHITLREVPNRKKNSIAKSRKRQRHHSLSKSRGFEPLSLASSFLF